MIGVVMVVVMVKRAIPVLLSGFDWMYVNRKW